jgi:hypothetical protein
LPKTLFIGDSHSAGYYMSNLNLPHPTPVFWADSNYANIYSKENEEHVALYAMPNASNKKYPIWLNSMLNKYSDIEQVFIQSTYWNRDLLAANKNLDIADGMKSEHFMKPGTDLYPVPLHRQHEFIERWTDELVTDNYIENCVRTAPNSKHLEYKGFSHEELHCGMENILNMPYAYVKLWHEHISHLQYREFCSNLFIIDTLCKRHNVKWYLWRINERIVMPNDIEFYGPLENCTRADISAEKYIKKYHGLNIEDLTLDGEHYKFNVHKIIAHEYIPYLKSLDKT